MTRPQTQPKLSVPSTRNRQRLRSRDWPRQPRRDPHVRVIAQLSELAGSDMSIIASSLRPWASATFIGAQHRIILRFAGKDAPERAARFAECLPEAEFAIAGHIVADACVDEWLRETDKREETADQDCTEKDHQAQAEGLTLRITVLTVEDW